MKKIDYYINGLNLCCIFTLNYSLYACITGSVCMAMMKVFMVIYFNCWAPSRCSFILAVLWQIEPTPLYQAIEWYMAVDHTIPTYISYIYMNTFRAASAGFSESGRCCVQTYNQALVKDFMNYNSFKWPISPFDKHPDSSTSPGIKKTRHQVDT